MVKIVAGVVELVDTLDLGSSAARCESSSLSARTLKLLFYERLFLYDSRKYQLFVIFLEELNWLTNSQL